MSACHCRALQGRGARLVENAPDRPGTACVIGRPAAPEHGATVRNADRSRRSPGQHCSAPPQTARRGPQGRGRVASEGTTARYVAVLARVDLPPAAVTPVVLLHALPFDGRMWQAEQAWLPGPTLAPTLYRFGSTLEDWASGVLHVAPADPFVIVGCSIGGSCALEVARAAPERVLGIVLVGAKAGVRPEPGVRDEACQVLAERGMEAAWRTWWRPLFGPSTPPETRPTP